MLRKAMDEFQLQKAKHIENVKAQYTDKGTVKNYFRASELGTGDRKLFYTFFAHQLPKRKKAAKNLRQLDNGNYVHDRYQEGWKAMGCLISMEERLSSKDNEDLKEFDWSLFGHYDGLLDANIIRGYALGKIRAVSAPVRDGNTGEVVYYEIEPQMDDDYAEEIGYFKPDYEPLKLVADIKTMNPWGFKAVKERGDLSSIQGYLDQISFYMYMLDTPYGTIFIENKEDNDTCEVQVVWTDFKGGEYDFSEYVHGDQEIGVVRTTINTERFTAIIERLNRLWKAVQEARELAHNGYAENAGKLVPERCADDPKSFPCSWGHKKGEPQYCEFYEHCWNPKTEGRSIFSEEVPEEYIWEFEAEDGSIVQIDSRKVPKTLKTPEDFLAAVEAYDTDITPFLVTPPEERITMDDIEEANNGDSLLDAEGNLIMDNSKRPSEAQEYTKEDGSKAVQCPKCSSEVTYKRLASNGIKKCTVCNHSIKVIRS